MKKNFHRYTATASADTPAAAGAVEDAVSPTLPEIKPPISIRTANGLHMHAIQTGWVAVHPNHRDLFGPAGTRLASILLDPRWTEWLPILTWVIEHPEGVIVIDTGETSRVVEPDFFNCDPGSNFVFRRILRFLVRPEEEIGAQMQGLGIAPESVRWVVQTHLHCDHAGGLDAVGDFGGGVEIDAQRGGGRGFCRFHGVGDSRGGKWRAGGERRRIVTPIRAARPWRPRLLALDQFASRTKAETALRDGVHPGERA